MGLEALTPLQSVGGGEDSSHIADTGRLLNVYSHTAALRPTKNCLVSQVHETLSMGKSILKLQAVLLHRMATCLICFECTVTLSTTHRQGGPRWLRLHAYELKWQGEGTVQWHVGDTVTPILEPVNIYIRLSQACTH